jgi:hypothetical protein
VQGQNRCLSPEAERIPSNASRYHTADRHQFGHAVKVRENLLYLAARQNHWELRRFFRALDLFQPADFMPKHLFVEKKQGAQRLVLGGGCDIEITRQMSEKVRNFLFGHFSRMPLAVVDDKPLNPVDISLLGADGVMRRMTSRT